MEMQSGIEKYEKWFFLLIFMKQNLFCLKTRINQGEIFIWQIIQSQSFWKIMSGWCGSLPFEGVNNDFMPHPDQSRNLCFLLLVALADILLKLFHSIFFCFLFATNLCIFFRRLPMIQQCTGAVCWLMN